MMSSYFLKLGQLQICLAIFTHKSLYAVTQVAYTVCVYY